MQTIFIFCKCELGMAYDVADKAILNVESISEVHSISGEHDLLMKAYLEDNIDLGHFVTDNIQLTMIGVALANALTPDLGRANAFYS